MENIDNFEIDCCKSRNSKKFSNVNLIVKDGIYFKISGNAHDPKIVVDILEKSNGLIETQVKFLELIKEKFGTSGKNARVILKEVVESGHVVASKYGRNKIKYCLPLYKIAA
jgi:hypothetical protein